MNEYQSKYYTCEEIDERLLKGYYDDAVVKGYSGTLVQFAYNMASQKTVDLSVIFPNDTITLLSEAITKLRTIVTQYPVGMLLKYQVLGYPKTYEFQGGDVTDTNNWNLINQSSLIKSALIGFAAYESLDKLPTKDLTSDQKLTGYVVDNELYVYVEKGGDTLDGLYEDVGPFTSGSSSKGYEVDEAKQLLIVTAATNTQYACHVDPYTVPNAPTITASGSDTDASRTISISSTTSGCTIEYSTDGGSNWKSGSSFTLAPSTSTYTGLSQSTQIKARATRNGLVSVVSTVTVTTHRHATTPTISVSESGTVTITQSQSGVKLYYTTNGDTPTTSSTEYTEAFSISASATIKVLAVLTDWENASASKTTYMMRYAVVSAAPTNEAGILAMTASFKDSSLPRNLTYSSSSTGKACIAYDKTIKDLTSILEVASGYERKPSWDGPTTVGNYKVYVQKEATDNDDVEFKFS